MNAILHIQNNLSMTIKLANTFFEARRRFYKNRNLLSFPSCAAIEQLLVILALFYALDIASLDNPIFVKKWSEQDFIILAAVIAPVGETIVFQFITIELLKKFKINTLLCGLISALIFGLAHINNSQHSLYFATIGGLYLAWGYNFWDNQSRFKALSSTIIQHSLFNSFICFELFF